MEKWNEIFFAFFFIAIQQAQALIRPIDRPSEANEMKRCWQAGEDEKKWEKRNEKRTKLKQCQSGRLYLKWSSKWNRTQFHSCACLCNWKAPTKKLRFLQCRTSLPQKNGMHLLFALFIFREKKRQKEKNERRAAELINSRQDYLSKYFCGNFPSFFLHSFIHCPPENGTHSALRKY